MGELAFLAAVLAPGITMTVEVLKGLVPPAIELPGQVWAGLALVIGIFLAVTIDIDTSALSVSGPTWLMQAAVGLTAGAIASGLYETKEIAAAKRANLDTRTDSLTDLNE